MNDIIKNVLASFFPPRCPLCGEITKGEDLYCTTCSIKHFEHDTRVFNVPMGKNAKMFAVYTGHYYEGCFKKYVERFKFYGKTSYCEKLSLIMHSEFKKMPHKSFDLIAYVPMDADKLKKRGYNQAKLLASALSQKINIPCIEIFDKIRHNKTQHSLNAVDRVENVKNAFKIKIDISGQKILLVDDIITTGATLCECARLCYKGGASLAVGICPANTR